MSHLEKNALTWFEIPTHEFSRAVSFYETLLDETLVPFPGDEPMSMFVGSEGGVSGALVQRDGMAPSANGTVVYLNVDGKLDATLKRAEKMNVRIVLPRTQVPGATSYYACIQDLEGNRVGLHSSCF